MKIKSKKALEIVSCYALVSFIWVFFSDKILYMETESLEYYRLLQTSKGIFFILITSTFLYKLIRNSHSEIETLNGKLEESLSELRSSHTELKKVAHVDYLTKLATRRFLMEKCELLFENAKRSEITLTILMFDIDYFKRYNDRYGHVEGDRILRIIGNLLKKNFKRKTDAIGRYGGEEFLVVLPHIDLISAISLVEKFQKKLKMCYLEHECSPFGEVTVSIGINSGKISKDENLDDFLRKVDEELYKAKKSGRNRYSFSENTEKEFFKNCNLNQINFK